MSRSCASWRGEIGTDVVGALGPRTSRQLAHHLSVCADCRAEYDDLVPVRDWLGLLSEDDAARASAGPARAAEASGPGRQAVPGGPQSLASGVLLARPRRRVLAAVAAIAVAAAAAGAIASSEGSAASFEGTDMATGVHGQAQLHATATGTQIRLTVTGLPRRESCMLVAETARGSAVAGTWYATPDGSAAITGWSAFRTGQLTWLRVESAGGRLLLSIPLGPARNGSGGG
jgi:hypothetical protein